MMAYVYIIRCTNNSLYCGISTDVTRRILEHKEQKKVCAKYTKSHTFEKVEAIWQSLNYSDAAKLEYQIKHLLKSKKENLIKDNSLFRTYFPMLSYLHYLRLDYDKLCCKKEENEDIFEKKIKANAKINLDLYVLGKRQDSYHLINSFMMPISLHDEITCSAKHSCEVKLELISNDTFDCSLEENTIYKAVFFCLSFLQTPLSINVQINKHIPLCSGMGGGSSDAAAIMLFINQFFHNKISQEDLIKIALEIGADVPFFLYNSPARCTGIGEKVHLISKKAIKDYYFVMISLGKKESTKEMFHLLDTCESIKNTYVSNELENAFISGDVSKMHEFCLNDFYEIYKNNELNHAFFAKLFEISKDTNWHLTGSGPTLFTFFDKKDEAVSLSRELLKNGIGNYISSSSLSFDGV